jgi:ribonucleotide reductase alpha subunit
MVEDIVNYINAILTHNVSIDDSIDIKLIISRVYQGLTDDYTYEDVYTLIFNVCDDLSSLHNKYSEYGAKLLYKKINDNLIDLNLYTFVEKVNYINDKLPKYLNQEYVKFINYNSEFMNELITSKNNLLPSFMDLFGYKTLIGSYLIKVDENIIENPCDLFLRVSTAIHFRSNDENKLELIEQSFNLMYDGYMTHATPTLFNAGTNFEQLSSCFLLGTEDSLDGIFKTFHDAGKISKWSGGVGIHVSNIRARGSKILSTNGNSDGIIPMLKV